VAELAQSYAQGRINPVVETRLPMRELRSAFARMAARDGRGKLVMLNRALPPESDDRRHRRPELRWPSGRLIE